ncbi:hypothetical protein SDC9_201741 [bioreactor metagenome]|uniref:Uncharacterized protein n=1 Tax=bioreactor metagenome TaxID=1076179 RepID=A0A645IT97_9ZZZZ
MPAKNAPMAKDNTLCLNKLIPIASAAISSSRIALKALPYEELIKSFKNITDNIIMPKKIHIEGISGIFLIPKAPFVMG